MRFVFLGPPGAGKGTHAKRLAEKYKLAHIAAGDCLRSHIRGETALGKKAKSIIEKGELVPDNLVNEMMDEEIWRTRINFRGFILDGYPRTIQQAKTLEKICKKYKMTIDSAVNFDTSEEKILDRLGGRLVCSKCSANFHIKNIPPKKEGVCDKCGNELIQRKDDNPETIKHRLEVYHESTAPLIDFYKEKELLHEVDGNQQLDPLQEEVSTFFEGFGSKTAAHEAEELDES